MARQIASVAYPAELCRLMGEEGVDPSKVLRGSGVSIETLASPDALITEQQLLRIYANAVDLARRPGLGLRFGARLRFTHHGILGHALLACASLRQMLRMAERYSVAVGSPFHFRLREEGGVAVLRAWDAAPIGKLHEMMVEEILALFAEEMPGSGHAILRPLEIRIDYPAPAHRRMYEKLFSCPILFDCESVEFTLAPETLDEPLQLSNAEIRRMCQQRCEVILSRLGLAGGIVDRVRSELLARRNRFPDLDGVAREIHVSPRTLRRKLRQEGASFSEVLGDVRKSLALDYLERSNLSMDEIALLLGYDNAANFSCAFRRWLGQPPGRYRKTRSGAE